MKNNLTNKPTNALKPLLSSRGFALIATISILSLIALISLALLSLATTKTKVSSYSNHLNIARDNARLALEIAIGQLQRYTGPDQRVTARADITDTDWTNLTPQVTNPYYHLAWDVSGSEIDYTANRIGYSNNHRYGYSRFPAYPGSWGSGGGKFPRTVFSKGTDNSYIHRPGMHPGHDFKNKLPAVLVSGNEFFDFTDGKGEWLTMAKYPDGYITPDTSLSSIPNIEIIPSQSIMVAGSLDSGVVDTSLKVEVPIVSIAGSTEGSSYAYWVGDESLKTRINLDSDLEEAASKVAQRSPILKSFQAAVTDEAQTRDVDKRITTAAVALNNSSSKKGFNYSSDITTSAESLVVDVRNGGFKKDFTFSLYNPDTLSPPELKDNSIPIDMMEGARTWTQYWSPGQGLLPMIEKWRNLAREPVEKGVAIEVVNDTRGLFPLMYQVQVAQHLAFSDETVGVAPLSQPAFSVHMGVFPSVTLWNPYNVPLRLSRNFNVQLQRRSFTLDQQRSRMKTDYDLQKADGSVVSSTVSWPLLGGWRPIQWSGWTMVLVIGTAANPVEIAPGETMVFSPSAVTRDDTPMNAVPVKAIYVNMEPGWNPGQGVLSRMDGKMHLLADYGGSLPKARIVQRQANDNLLWTLTTQGRAGSRYLYWNRNSVGASPVTVRCSQWSRLDAVAQDTSSFFTVPSVTDVRQDASGSFPGLLIKHALRMGDDYLLTPSAAIKPNQLSLSFPYVAGYNPAALSHAGFGDSNRTGNSAEAVNISPSLMGGVSDYQTANVIYPVTTKPSSLQSTPIGLGYLNGEKMILMNRPFASTLPNGSSASITSFSQLNNSQFLKGQRQYITVGTAHAVGYISSSNIPTFPIGNSIGNPKLDLEHKGSTFYTTTYMGSIGKIMSSARLQWMVDSMELDYSYILNEHLYDHYFFSTIPQSATDYDSTKPLVNSRLVPDAEVKSDHAKLKTIDVAEHLRLVGGFNVNSTSVPAWEMLLSSSLGTKRTGVSNLDSTVSFSNKEATGALSSKSITEAQALDSNFHMSLTQAEIRELAEAMVSEVKRRGPFPSLSAFVNRANFLKDMARSNPNGFVGTDGTIDARYSGAIQSALDRIDANAGLDGTANSNRIITKSDFAESSGAGAILPARNALRKTVNSHLPGYLKQSDVLAQIAPVITVRGDTFTIRCFGSSGKDANGQPIAKVVCEAVVQRGKEFVDSTANTYDTPVKTAVSGTAGTTSTLVDRNKEFGRKYKIVSFKWLSQAEVDQMTISNL